MCIVNLTGCGGTTTAGNNDSPTVPSTETLQAMGTQLIEAGVFEGEMAEVNRKMVTEAYKLENSEVLAAYMSTASKADEITIIQTNDVNKTEELAQTYLEDRKTVYESYAPEESGKLQKALVITYEDSDENPDGEKAGVCIICVTDKTEEAENLIQKYTK